MDNSKTPLQKTKVENASDGLNRASTSHSPTLPTDLNEIERMRGLICPNCGGALQNRKCKLLCVRTGCGYQVTCSEW